MRCFLAFLLALFFGGASHAQTQVQFGLQTGSNPRALGVYDQAHTFVPFANLDSTGHTLTFTGPATLSSLTIAGYLAATTSGALTNGHCVAINATGNLVDAGGACNVGGGGTVSSGAAGQIAYYASSGTTVSGATTGTGVLAALAAPLNATGGLLGYALIGTPQGSYSALTGLGSAANYATGVSGATIPMLNGANIWSLTQTFAVNPTFSNCTGYLYGNGSSAATCATTVPARPPSQKQVATRSYIPVKLGSFLQCMGRTMHVARDNITALQAAYASWAAIASSGETNAPATLNFKVDVEYPAGTYTPLKWGGVTVNAQAPGQSTLSDATAVNIPKNAVFWMRPYITTSTGTSGMPYTGNNDANGGPMYAAGGDALNCGSSVADQTGGGAIVDNQSGQAAIYPVALVAQTSVRSVLIVGDSIAWGYRDSPTYGGDVGSIARSIGGTMGYINASVFGDSVNGIVSGHANRVALAQYATDVIVTTGTNDVAAGFAEATILSNLNAIWGYFPGKPVYQATFIPYSTSTDNFFTVANQTPNTYNGVRVDLNTQIRSVPSANLTGFIEIGDVLENYRDGGKWAVLLGPNCSGYCQYTYDGIHPNYPAYGLIQRSGAVMTALTAGRYN